MGILDVPASPTRSKAGIYVPKDWGQFIYPKLRAAKAGTDKAVIACVGDSITQGFRSSDLIRKSWVGLLTTAVQAAYGDGGGGFLGAANSSKIAGVVTGLPSDNLWTLAPGANWTGQANATQYEGPGFSAFYSTASTPGQQGSCVVRGTTVSIYYETYTGGGTFTPRIDGVAQTNVSTNAASGIAVATYSGLSAGTHTIMVDIQTSTGSVIIFGASGENATGTVVNRFGRSGATAAVSASTSATFGKGSKWTGGPSYPADLVIYGMYVNDANTAVASDTYYSNVSAYLKAVRDSGAPKNGATDLLVLWPHIGNYDNATPTADTYAYRMRSLCEHYGAAFLDVGAVLHNAYAQGTAISYWSDGTNTGVPGTDAVHPGDLGHAYIWSLLSPILLAA